MAWTPGKVQAVLIRLRPMAPSKPMRLPDKPMYTSPRTLASQDRTSYAQPRR